MARTVPKRSEIAQEHTWNPESIFSSRDAWEREVDYINQQLPELAHYQGKLGQSPSTLAEWFEVKKDLLVRLGKVFIYTNLLHSVDLADQEAAALNSRARALNARVQGALAFDEPEIVEIGRETLQQWMAQEPDLRKYDHYFNNLERRHAHIRSPEVEELLNLVADPFRTATASHGILTDADLEFDPACSADGEARPIAQGTIDSLLTEPDRELRRTAWENYADSHLQYKNTMANIVASGVKQHVFTARARRYNSSLEAALDPNNIDPTVFYNLIDTFRRNLPIWHRYWEVRRRALRYQTLYPYDIKAPLSKTPPKVSFEQAVEWISDGMQPLGDEYVTVMRRGLLEERWVDLYPNKGKRSGAFSTGTPGTYPFILMSYTDDLYSLSTLAHELGHSMHSYYSWSSQPLVYSRYSIFVAEVASNFNQALVRAYLLEENRDPEFQIALIEEALSNFHRYFFIMPTLARFELELHERVEKGEGLTADGMIELMTSLFREGYADGVDVDENANRIGITWAQFPTHLYLNYYVYQYATGISGAHALANSVLAGEPNAVERYLDFLRAGSSLYPLDALKLAGVDLTQPDPVEQTFQVLAGLVDRLDRLIEQRR